MDMKMEMIWWGNISRQLEDFMQQAMDRENYRPTVLDTMKKAKDENFKTEWGQLQINPKWAPLSVSTARARSRRTGYYKNPPNSPGLLRWTGNLQTNISTTADKLACTMTFNADYAHWHQEWQWSKHRAIFEFSNPVKAEIMRSIQTKFNEYVGIWNARKSS